MLTVKEHGVWNDRWKALEARLENLYPATKSNFSREDTLRNLAECLKIFADGQFNYFLNGFSQNGNLQESPEYPPHYVLRVILDQVAFDLEVIERAIHQRQSSDASTLEKADKLALNSLEPAVYNNLLGNTETSVITYFQKSTSIRVIPYAPVALIGIPFTVENVPRDYLAIPHEIGHYVYRHGKFGKTPIPQVLREKVASLSGEVGNWIEEIFADVYGCRVGGLVMAIDFQDLQLEHSKSVFSNGDGVHPTPFLRPYVYAHTLQMRNFENSVDGLKGSWKTKLKEKRGETTDVERYIVIDDMKEVIGEILDNLLSNLAGSSWSTDTPNLVTAENIDKQLDDFDNTPVDSLSSSIFEVKEFEPIKPFEYEKWKTELLSEETQPDQGNDVPISIWLKVLDADGWATRGPSSHD